MKICPKCMTANPDDEKSCKLCLAPMEQSGGRICPAGKHTMDPAWTECRYCKAEGASGGGGHPSPLPPRPPAMPPGAGARAKTMVEGSTFVETSAAPPRPPMRPPTHREESPLPPRPAPNPSASGAPPQPAPNRNKTVYGSPVPSLTSTNNARKIVGLLISYSWRPEGKVYEVREGRNLIGRESTCDICVPEDETLSGINSHITYRQNFVIGDMVSMMGTDVDGVPIEQQFESLRNYATVRAGSTHFTFIAVVPRPESPGVGG